MELCVQLKVCEGCGCLWYRAQNHMSVYCCACEVRLQEFPAPDTRKRRGPQNVRPLLQTMALAEAAGGAE